MSETNRIVRPHRSPVPIDYSELERQIAELQSRIEAGEKPPSPPSFPLFRHPLTHFDVWFNLAALVCCLIITSSFIPAYAFEGLIFGAIGFNLLTLIARLTGTREEIHERHRFHKRSVPLFVFDFGPKQSLRDIQARHLGLD